MPEKKKRRIVTYISLGNYKREDSEPLPENWDEMTEKEQREYLDDAAQTTLQNHADFGAYVKEEG